MAVVANPKAGPTMLERIRRYFQGPSEEELQKRLDDLRRKTPAPVFWLFGKTQSGKTTVIKYLTGATDAEVGEGFRPCTRFSRYYEFPAPEAPLLSFLDTRGLDEPGYDPTEDINQFGGRTHVVIVTVKALDHAQAGVLDHLRAIRASNPERPIVLTLTCLHEAYPQRNHPQPYPFPAFDPAKPVTDQFAHDPAAVEPDLVRSLEAQRQRFEGLVDRIVAVDITRPEDGFEDPIYGGPRLRETLQTLLPAAYRQTFAALETAVREFHDLHARRALPTLVGYSAMAATAGAIPVPFVDLMLLPGLQKRMVEQLARVYGRPDQAEPFLQTAQALHLVGSTRQLIMGEFAKVVPSIGAMTCATLAGRATYALGRAFCYYLAEQRAGHLPKPEELAGFYRDQLAKAEEAWKGRA